MRGSWPSSKLVINSSLLVVHGGSISGSPAPRTDLFHPSTDLHRRMAEDWANGAARETIRELHVF